ETSGVVDGPRRPGPLPDGDHRRRFGPPRGPTPPTAPPDGPHGGHRRRARQAPIAVGLERTQPPRHACDQGGGGSVEAAESAPTGSFRTGSQVRIRPTER